MANDFSNIVTKLNGSAWFITPEALTVMLDILDKRMSGVELSKAEIRARLENLDHDRQFKDGQNVRGIGVLPLYGPIFPKANLMTEMSGATSLEVFRNDFRQMMENPFISTILLDIDSPGGYADMIPETAREIRNARDQKDIVAVANTSMNSAAYYLGSQANRVYATDSAQVGSVGVISVHTDDTKRQEMEGVKHTYISAGRFKAELAEPLTDESRNYLQSHVDDLYEDFVNDVAIGRGTDSQYVRDNYGEGRVLLPKDALKVGMIDGIRTFDSILGRLIESGGDINALDANAPVPVQAQNVVNHVHIGMADIDKEHSEPGTGQGGEPVPREAPEAGDKAIEGGWRRDPPPIAYELEDEEMNREWLEARATALGIEFSADMEDSVLADTVAAKVDGMIAPIAMATGEAEKQRQFAKDYPEQAAALAQLEARNRGSEAHEFAEGYQSFTEDSKRGFSNVVREKIEQTHLKIAERTISHDDLKDLLDSTTSNTAIVEFGEVGSARSVDGEKVAPGKTTQETRAAVAELIRTAMTEDGLDRQNAMNHVANQHPDLWAAYVENR